MQLHKAIVGRCEISAIDSQHATSKVTLLAASVAEEL